MNIVDELIVSLSLDPTKFKQGQKEAVAALKKLEEQAAGGGKNIQRSVGGVEESFGLLQKRLIGVAALLFGGLSIDRFIEKMTKLNVATSNLSGWTGVSTQNLRTWSQAAERAGVSGDAAAQGFSAITRQRTDWLNNRNQGGLMIFQRGANSAARINKGTGVDLFGGADNSTLLPDEQVAERLHNWLQTEIKAGRGVTARGALHTNAGLPEEFITLLANPKMKEFLAEAKKNAPTDKEVADYKKLNEAATGAHQSIELLARSMVNASGAVPKLTEFFNFLSKVVNYWTGDPETKKQVDAEGNALHDDLQKKLGNTDESGDKPWWERLNDAINQKLGVRPHGDTEALGTGKQLQENTEELRKLNDKLKGGLQNQSFTGGGGPADGGGGLLHNIMYSGGSAADGGVGGSGVGSRLPGGSGGGNSGSSMPAAGAGSYGNVGSGKRAVAQAAASEMRKAGLSDKAIAGIFANVQDESTFNPNLRHADQPKFSGEAHYAHGLYQEGGTEWNRYAGWLAKNYAGADWRDPKLQTRFLMENLKTNYSGLWKRLQGAKSSGEAAQLFVQQYLKPARPYMIGRSNKYGRGVPGVEHYGVGKDAPDTPTTETAPMPTADPRRAREWTNLIGSSHLAAYSPGGSGGISTSSNMTIGDVHVHTAATDAQGIAKALKPALQRFAGVMSSNNGPT